MYLELTDSLSDCYIRKQMLNQLQFFYCLTALLIMRFCCGHNATPWSPSKKSIYTILFFTGRKYSQMHKSQKSKFWGLAVEHKSLTLIYVGWLNLVDDT